MPYLRTCLIQVFMAASDARVVLPAPAVRRFRRRNPFRCFRRRQPFGCFCRRAPLWRLRIRRRGLDSGQRRQPYSCVDHVHSSDRLKVLPTRQTGVIKQRRAPIHPRIRTTALAARRNPANVQRKRCSRRIEQPFRFRCGCRCQVRSLCLTWLKGTPRSAAYSRGKPRTLSPITLRAISSLPPPSATVWRDR
jgi:hypothetical protein